MARKEGPSVGLREFQPRLDPLSGRIKDYLPSSEILAIRPTLLDLQRRDEYKRTRPGDDFALVLHKGKLNIVPSWHPLNQTPMSANLAVYGTGSMETFGFEPVLDMNTETQERDIVSGNIVLLSPRINRLYDRALPAREVQFPIDRMIFAQGITDLMAVLGKRVLIGQDGRIGRGSIRLLVGPGMGKFGKSAVGAEVNAAVESYYGRNAFPEKAYNGTGLVVSAGPDQRFNPFLGKHSSHYGDGGRIGEIAKRLGAEDALLFASYYASDPTRVDVLSRYKNDPKGLENAAMRLALANGLGAELFAVQQNGTLLLPPMDVNRLGGTTADYIVKHMAPRLKIPTRIAPYSLEDVVNGDMGLFFAGNAARIAAIRQVRLHDADERVMRDIQLRVPQTTMSLIHRFEKEVEGVIPPTHKSLITSVDLAEGEKARMVLNQAFEGWV